MLIGGTPETPVPGGRLGRFSLGAFLSPRARRRAAAFLGVPVALHPGEIDRLR